ncbi:MAG: GNAT family N-acetyltransferase [Armatimonadetes bacterium]|nr:GNAT family N-acetyltransferase [Armatimonadota bacterium]
MQGLICREYCPEDTADVLEVRNPIFGPLSEEDWDRYCPRMTAGMGYLDGEVVGAIPLDQRDFLLAPQVSVPVAFENCVGVKEEYRSRGIGGAIIEAAREFMADRCDLLMVYRGGERSAGYRFYHKSGHRDLLYLAQVRWDPPSGLCSDAQRVHIEVLHNHEDEILRVYNSTYCSYGGHAPRCRGYWREALAGQIFMAEPAEILFYRYPAAGEIVAYGIFQIHEDDSEGKVEVLEIASRTGIGGAREVLKAAAVEAYKRNAAVIDRVSVHHPYRYLYRELGFVEDLRSLIIMGQVINPQRLFRRVCGFPELVADLRINVWTPTKDYVLFEGPEVKKEIILEGKDIIIERLLTRRLDVMSAFRHDLLTIRNGDEAIAACLAEALPFSPWCHHHLDWI